MLTMRLNMTINMLVVRLVTVSNNHHSNNDNHDKKKNTAIIAVLRQLKRD